MDMSILFTVFDDILKCGGDLNSYIDMKKKMDSHITICSNVKAWSVNGSAVLTRQKSKDAPMK